MKLPIKAKPLSMLGVFYRVKDAGGATIESHLTKEHAEKIVAAVNAHDQLVAALRPFAELAKYVEDMREGAVQFELSAQDLHAARAALTAAGAA